MLFFVVVINPLISLHLSWKEELDKQRLLLAKYHMLQAQQGRAAQTSKTQKDSLEKLEGRFLSGSSPTVAASELQEIVKNMTESYGLQVSSTKVLPPRETGLYMEVPLEVQLNLNTRQLLTLLYHLENHRKFLSISQLEVISPSYRRGSTKDSPILQTRLTISGVIKGAPPKGRPPV